MEQLQAVAEWVGQNAALIVAACALYITTRQVAASHKHNRMSVRPHLIVTVDRLFEGSSAVLLAKVRNSGLGPAIVRKFEAQVDGEVIDTRNHDRVADKAASLAGRPPLKCYNFHFSDGDAIGKDQEVTLLRAEFPIFLDDLRNDFFKSFDRLTATIKYESIYGDEFVYKTEIVEK